MYRLGSRTHALVGLWILAGLMVVGVNGYVLMALMDEPLAGYSSEVRDVERSLRRYGQLLTAEAQKAISGIDRLASRFAPVAVEPEKPALQKSTARSAAVKQTVDLPVVLPSLTGIVTSRRTDGTANRLAVMDGRICVEGDRLGELTVTLIDVDGVSLVSDDRAWFLKAPEIAYSLTTQ